MVKKSKKKLEKLQIFRLKKVYIDTQIFIYLFESNKYYIEVVEKLFNILIFNKISICTSAITLSEILRSPKVQNNKRLRDKIKNSLFTLSKIKIIDFYKSISEYSAFLGNKYNLNFQDSVHLTTAILEDCDTFITNDRVLKKVKEIKLIIISEYQN